MLSDAAPSGVFVRKDRALRGAGNGTPSSSQLAPSEPVSETTSTASFVSLVFSSIKTGTGFSAASVNFLFAVYFEMSHQI